MKYHKNFFALLWKPMLVPFVGGFRAARTSGASGLLYLRINFSRSFFRLPANSCEVHCWLWQLYLR